MFDEIEGHIYILTSDPRVELVPRCELQLYITI